MPFENGHATLDPEYAWVDEAERSLQIYVRGYEEGEASVFKRLQQLDNQDLEVAQIISTDIFLRLVKEMDIECEKIYLRPHRGGTGGFDSIFFVGLEERVSKGFRKAYKIAAEEQERAKGLGLDYEYAFMPVRGHIDRSALAADGYVYWFPAKVETDEN